MTFRLKYRLLATLTLLSAFALITPTTNAWADGESSYAVAEEEDGETYCRPNGFENCPPGGIKVDDPDTR